MLDAPGSSSSDPQVEHKTDDALSASRRGFLQIGALVATGIAGACAPGAGGAGATGGTTGAGGTTGGADNRAAVTGGADSRAAATDADSAPVG